MTVAAISAADLSFLCCPYQDHGNLRQTAPDRLLCESCNRWFALAEGRPILFDETKSIFSSEQVVALGDTRQFPDTSGWRYRLRSLLPAGSSRDISLDLIKAHPALLPNGPTVLVIGCGFTPDRYGEYFSSGRLFLTDVTLKGNASIACDGECLPFRDESMDCIVVDQVLEHALNPLSVVGEIYRCLKPNGLVYSGIPFLTPVHGFPYDFQRYTPMGHRLLFRRFREIDFRVTQGPVSALSKTLIGFLCSLSSNVWWRRVCSVGVRVLVRPVLWMDKHYTTTRALTIPAASAFLGCKRAIEEKPVDIMSQWSNGDRKACTKHALELSDHAAAPNRADAVGPDGQANGLLS